MRAFAPLRRATPQRQLSHWQAAGLAAVALAVLAGAGYRVDAQWALAAPASPAQAIRAAATSSAALTSVSATFSTEVSGIPVAFGTVREQRSPHRLATLAMTTVDGSERIAVAEVFASSTVYVAMPSLAAAVGRPWLGVPVRELAADPAMAGLYQTEAIPSAEAGLLAFVTKARQAENSFIGGKPVTRYVATVNPATALAKLSPALRQLLAPELRATTGQILVAVWIDSQQDIRKIVTSSVVGGLRTVTTIVVTAQNPAVHLKVPPASRVADMPTSGLVTTN